LHRGDAGKSRRVAALEIIGPYDLMLAGQALALGVPLVTHNTGEFTRVPGLMLEDWQSAK